MKILVKVAQIIFLHFYSFVLCLGAVVSIRITALVFYTHSKIIYTVFDKNKSNVIFFIFPFITYDSWKEYLSILKQFIQQTSFLKSFWIPYFKYRKWNSTSTTYRPYFKFPISNSKIKFYDESIFPFLQNLKENQDIILQEYKNALSYLKPYVNEAGDIHNDWKTIMLYINGILNDKPKASFTNTLNILKSMNEVENSMVMFSVLSPGAMIPEHTGPYNALLRVHLPLLLPKDNEQCNLFVSTINKKWQYNRYMIFDDAYPHSVINNSNDTRVVLMFSIWKNDIPQDMKCLIKKYINLFNSSPPFQNWMLSNI